MIRSLNKKLTNEHSQLKPFLSKTIPTKEFGGLISWRPAGPTATPAGLKHCLLLGKTAMLCAFAGFPSFPSSQKFGLADTTTVKKKKQRKTEDKIIFLFMLEGTNFWTLQILCLNAVLVPSTEIMPLMIADFSKPWHSQLVHWAVQLTGCWMNARNDQLQQYDFLHQQFSGT